MSIKDYIDKVLAYNDDCDVKSDLLYYKEFEDFMFELFYSEHFQCLVKFIGNRAFLEQEGGWTFYSSSHSAIDTLKNKAGLKNIKKYLTG
ncbi:hypothetical protein BRC2024_KCUCJSVR_CDS_0071 [Acinetobacter phage vB_AbaM_KissB]|uniref:hypothetical protein n=1 Tax=Acinetobacter phage vB_AbaM_phiAbaA1 TaxID=1605379 RepID=UPI00078D21E7|nr:hypothetical protein BJD49_gp077 [Acinetobacter phage vB_AbaM_phiAbaA1]AJK27213.1 hypothetical protein phiAbaA1_110 [Acinetobacter phage vB_AbaM_phiAbaA1]